MDENERERDNLTENEAEEVERGTMDAEESHRYGEFEELRGLIEGVRDMLEDVKDMVASVKDGRGMFVENGATVKEDTAGDGVPDAVEFDTEGNIEEFVYNLDDLDLDM